MESLFHTDAVSSSEEMLTELTLPLLPSPLSLAVQVKPSLANTFQ